MRDIDLLSVVLQTPGAMAPIVVGPPGCGKTSRIYQLAAHLGLPCEVVIASIREPSDFAGLPIPDNGHGVRMEPPSWAIRLKELGKGILLLDECSCSPPAVQAALLRVVLERTVGDLTLPDGVKVIAAANPPDQAAGGWDLALPLSNRFVHLQWGAPSAEEWTNWLLSDNAPHHGVRVHPEAWQAQWPQAKALVSAFLRRRPGLLTENPAKIQGRFPMAYATPRSWETATRLLASCRTLPDGVDAALTLVAGAVGEPVALELAAWLRENDLPDPEELLADPESFKPDAKYPDRCFAVCVAVAETVLGTKNGKYSKAAYSKRWHAAWRVLARAVPLGKDVVVIAGRRIAHADHRPDDGLKDERVKKLIADLTPVVQASGIGGG